jgi:hypothetical protein
MATLAARFYFPIPLKAEKRRNFFVFPFVSMNNIAVFCNKIGRGAAGGEKPSE